MPYTINKYNGQVVATVADGTIDSSTDLKLIGKNYAGYWWDTQNKQLYTWDGASYILVGPQGVAGSQTTQMRSRSVRDTLSATHAIIEAVVDGDTIFVVSADSTFTLDPTTSSINGFTKIQQGITLAYTNNDTFLGQTVNANHRFWGTATNSDRLGGVLAENFVQKGSAVFNSLVGFSDAGFTVGDTPRLRVFNNTTGLTTFPVIQNQLNDTIKFQTTVGAATKTPLQLVGSDILPGVDNQSDIGSGALRFKTVNAVTFAGTSTRSDSLYVAADDYRTASSASSSGSIAVRTNSTEVINGVNITAGALKATYFVGTATAANYADLAEKYLADQEYECQNGDRAIGAVSANPAYMMNAELAGGTFIALKGRVPVKVSGAVKKGDRMVAGPNGTAKSSVDTNVTIDNADTFAIALESNTSDNVKLVECLIL